MNMLFIHKVRRPAIHAGDTVCFKNNCTGLKRTGKAVRRIGKVWDVQVVEGQKTMTWQLPREDLYTVPVRSN